MKKSIQIIAFLLMINILLSFSCSKSNDIITTPTTINASLQNNWVLDSVEIYNNAQLAGQRVKFNSFGGSIDFRTDNKAYANDSVQIHNVQLRNIYDTFNYSLSQDDKFIYTNLIYKGIPVLKSDTSSIMLLTDHRLVLGLISASPLDSSYVYGLSSYYIIYPKFYYHR